jgi:hypothetical protein
MIGLTYVIMDHSHDTSTEQKINLGQLRCWEKSSTLLCDR